ncbi:kinase activity protein [[Candida] boidinii]|nr:kinase activity protein [[Candida] boidinii]
MSDHSEIADIQEPVIPGNYSARKQNRWIPSDTTSSNTDSNKLPGEDGQSVNNTTINDATSNNQHNKDSNDGKSKNAISNSKHHQDIDEIHSSIPKDYISPAQMYSTDSGRLYHAGSICIVLVGKPARGKTNLSISLCRYLRWLGVKTKLFHMADYRRENVGALPKNFFNPKPQDEEAFKVRKFLSGLVADDVTKFFNAENGQIAIYDAVNGISSERIELKEKLEKQNIRVIFIESLIDNQFLLDRNIADAASSPDYIGWEGKKAVEDYKLRIEMVNSNYEEMSEENLTYIKFINFGERLIINNSQYDFLISRMVFFLINSKIKSGSIYFARCSNNKLKFKSDPPIDDKGKNYADKLFNTVINDIKANNNEKDEKNLKDKLLVWTSTRLRTNQLVQVFRDIGISTFPRPELTQKNPGDVEGLTEDEIKSKFQDDYERHQLDPYHHRYPRAESYHDLAVRFEPLIMEIERLDNDILIVADETVIRILYGYLMASSGTDIPYLEFPQSEIVKITCNAYANKATRIKIDGIESS